MPLCVCSHSPNDVPLEPQRNVSIAAVRGAVRPSMNATVTVDPFYIVQSLFISNMLANVLISLCGFSQNLF